MVEYSADMKHAYFNGETLTRDEKTGYYLTTNNAKQVGRRLHRAVWEYYNGNIPKGYEVHHVDHDKNNNEIENLCMMAMEKHRKLHGEEIDDGIREFRRKNMLKNAIPAAAEWHSSDSGREWHRIQYERTKDKLHKKVTAVCALCGEEYEAEENGHNRFCSNKCKSAWRRKNGMNDEKRVCVVCGNEFMTDKYKKAKTCSPKCAALSRRGIST